MPQLALLVHGLEDHEQPVFLASVRLPAGNYDKRSRLSDEQLVRLMQQLEQGPTPLAGTYTRFTMLLLLDGLPVGHEEWDESVLPGGERCVQLASGNYLRLRNDYFDDAAPVITL